MTPKQRKWLDLIRLASSGGGMYRGERADTIPPRHLNTFDRNGWIVWARPHNPSHVERVVITDAGMAVLKNKD